VVGWHHPIRIKWDGSWVRITEEAEQVPTGRLSRRLSQAAVAPLNLRQPPTFQVDVAAVASLAKVPGRMQSFEGLVSQKGEREGSCGA
jgi:hypothetical protein